MIAGSPVGVAFSATSNHRCVAGATDFNANPGDYLCLVRTKCVALAVATCSAHR